MPDYPDKIDSFALSAGPAIPLQDLQARLRGGGRSGSPRNLDGDPHKKLALAVIVQGVKHGDEDWLRSPQCQLLVETLAMDYDKFLEGCRRKGAIA